MTDIKRTFMKKKKEGIASIFLLALLPVIIYGVMYLTKYSKKSDIDTSNFEIPYVIGKNLSQVFNPGKTWSEQEAYLYSVAAQTYNDEFFDTTKQMSFTPSSICKARMYYTSSSIASLYDFYRKYCNYGRMESDETFIDSEEVFVDRQPISDLIYNEAEQLGTYYKYLPSGNGDVAYSFSKYDKKDSKLQLSFNDNGQIKVSCKELNREATVDLPRSDVDIVIAIPTNRASNTTTNNKDGTFGDYSKASDANDTPIKQIARACQAFLKPFLHTAGVAVGIIPYSGKVTMSPYSDYRNYTTQILMNSNQATLPYAIQAMFYASDGKSGGDIIARNSNLVADSYGEYANWGSSTIGLPIMARRGQVQSYRGMTLNSGSSGKTGAESLLLDMTTPPTFSDDYKFMRMNTNPCYLGFCNTLAMTCEKDCPTYMANPYFMSGLTSDIQSVIHDLDLFVPFKDEKNKSNFLFLPIVMAGNMFSWGDHPSELSSTGRIKEEERGKKSRFVIIIANAPDNFEPQEMTYLGFNNDYSEIPMIESDTILFNKDRGYMEDTENAKYKGVKGAVQFSGSGTLEEGRGFNLNKTARISFPHKGLLRIVAEKGENSIVTVGSDNKVVDNVGTNTFSGKMTLSFQGPKQVRTYSDQVTAFKSGYYTTKGPNFGHNLSVKKVKIGLSGCRLTKAKLWNQVLRFYGSYSKDNGQELIENDSGSVWSDAPANMKKRMDPCIDASSYYNDSIDGWLFYSNTKEGGYNRYYIKANQFQPTCYGVKQINQFICAADGFPADSTIFPEDAQIYDTSSSKWVSIDNINYDTSNGTKYRCFTKCYRYPSSYDYIKINTGKFKIDELYYYKRFASEKKRTRTLKQRITTTRDYPTTSTSGCECCLPNNDNGGVLDNTKPMPCDEVVYLHPDNRTYSQTGWTEHNSTKYECLGRDQPQTWNISEFQKTQEQESSGCSYRDGEMGNSTCSYPSEPAYDWISAIGNYSGWKCGNCHRAPGFNCWAGCSMTGSRDTDIPNWEESVSAYKRLYACYKRKDNGSLNLTYQICDDKDGGRNCSSTTYSGTDNFAVTGILDAVRTNGVNYKFNLYNFFFVNSDEITSSFSYDDKGKLSSNGINSYSDANLLKNKGIYLKSEGSDYWVCFCGDADLQLDFEDTYSGAEISFSNIEKDQYRIAFDNTGEITNTAGVSATNIDNQQIFYIIPEQMKNTTDTDGNYYVDLNISGKIRIVSVELSNRPYKLLEPTTEIVEADDNKGKSIGDGTNEFVEFKTNLKTSFSFLATPIYFWLEGTSDFRQTSGTAKICGNSNKISGCIVQASVPDLGSGIMILTEKKKTNSREYTITSDRKVKKIHDIPKFTIPKVSFSGAVSKTYEFGAEEIAAGEGSFKWPSSNFSHKPFDEKTDWTANKNPYKQTFTASDKQRTISFDLQACSLKQVYAKNLIMKFSPTVNDFPSVSIASRYTGCDPLRYDDSLGFYADTCYYGPPYGVQVDLQWAYNQYGSGTITTYGYKKSGAATMTLYVNGDGKDFSNTGDYSHSGDCTGSSVALSKVYYGGSKNGKYNYLSSCEYKVSSYDLKNKVTYSSSDKTNHNYKGSIPFYGVADINVDVTPQKIKLTDKYKTDVTENKITGNFGNYKYTWSITSPSFTLNLDSEELKRDTHFDLAYTNGTFNGTNIPAGNTQSFSGISTTTAYNGYYCKNVAVKNVVLSIPISKVHSVNGKTLTTPKPGAASGTTFTISPDTHTFELKNDGYFHVKVPCRNVYISNAKVVDASKVRVYDHPNIIKEELINTRIIDGYDRATYQNMKKYGNINYNNTSLPSVSPVQRLFYYSKPNNNEVYLYPKANGAGAASAGEEGDFFIQLWDHNNEIPAVRWKIGSSIQLSTSDISVENSGFGAFKSNYAFNGLHRMFFPYDVYNKDYAGYSYASNSAFVFAGYTLPINLILSNNGYQNGAFQVDSADISNYTDSNTALSNLAKDACKRLKQDLKANQEEPFIFLVKYRTDDTLSLESCTNDKYTASNEADLTTTLINIAKMIKEVTQTSILRIDVKNITKQ